MGPPRPPPPSQRSLSIKSYTKSGRERDTSTSRRSSSTESANSLPDISDDEELPPLILDDKSPRKSKKSSKETVTEKPKPTLPERPKTKKPSTLPVKSSKHAIESEPSEKDRTEKMAKDENGEEKEDEHK